MIYFEPVNLKQWNMLESDRLGTGAWKRFGAVSSGQGMGRRIPRG